MVEQEDLKFKTILSYIASLRPTWDVLDLASKKKIITAIINAHSHIFMALFIAMPRYG